MTQTLWKLISYQVDIMKDIILAISLLFIIGGPATIYNFPTKFPSVIVILYGVTIISPIFFMIVQLTTIHPYIILHFMRKTATGIKRITMKIICICLSSFNYAFLVFNLEVTREKAISKAKHSSERAEDDILKLFAECKLIKKEIIQIFKIELGLKLTKQFVTILMFTLYNHY